MRFEYLEPTSIQEAIALLERHDGKARIIAGGTDLLVQMRRRTIKPEYVINIGNIHWLDYIKYDENEGLKIGALTTIRTLERSPQVQQRYPVISQAASQLASVGVRNLATLGGNLCNAAPSADTAPPLIALSARARIVGPEGERVVPLEDFFTGPGSTILKKGEILTEIQVPVLQPRTGAVYLKHDIRGTLDLAIVGAAVAITLEPRSEVCQDARVVLGAVAPTPMRARLAEESLKGKEINRAIIEKSAQVASTESKPITDVRAPAAYRGEMVKVFAQRAITEALRLAKLA